MRQAPEPLQKALEVIAIWKSDGASVRSGDPPGRLKWGGIKSHGLRRGLRAVATPRQPPCGRGTVALWYWWSPVRIFSKGLGHLPRARFREDFSKSAEGITDLG